MTVSYPPKCTLAQLPTPLQPLERLSAELGGPRIWVKRDDLTGCAISGNKVRKLEFVLAEALAQGCNTIITCGGVQSNHCRATAVLCAQLGLRCHLVLRGEAPEQADGNLFLDQLVGAEISYYPLREYQQSLGSLLQQWQAHYADRGDKAFIIPTGASNEIGLWGYIAAAEELKQDFAAQGLDNCHILCATGSGSTHGGLIMGNHLFDVQARVSAVNVCDNREYFVKKIDEDYRAWQQRYAMAVDTAQLPINIIEGYVGPGYGRATRDVFALIKKMAVTEGLILDPVYTGKAFFGLVDSLKRGRFDGCDNLIFIHTGGIFGLFPQKEHVPTNA